MCHHNHTKRAAVAIDQRRASCGATSKSVSRWAVICWNTIMIATSASRLGQTFAPALLVLVNVVRSSGTISFMHCSAARTDDRAMKKNAFMQAATSIRRRCAVPYPCAQHQSATYTDAVPICNCRRCNIQPATCNSQCAPYGTTHKRRCTRVLRKSWHRIVSSGMRIELAAYNARPRVCYGSMLTRVL